MAGAIIKRFVFIHPCDWNNWEHYGDGQQIRPCAKLGVCKFEIFIVVKHVLGRRVNFKCFSVLFQNEKLCGNFYLDPVENILKCNLMKMFLHVCLIVCLLVRFNMWQSRTFWLNRCGICRSCIARSFGWKCTNVEMMWVSQRRCWNMPQQNSGIICCRCTMTSFITALCLNRGVTLYLTCCPKRCDQHKLLIFGQ